MTPSPTPCPAPVHDVHARHVSLDLPMTPRAAALARQATREALDAWELRSADWAHDVCLVVTELVANAVQHGGAGLALELWFARGDVTVAVVDGACGLPRPRPSRDDDESGRGMAIVAALARNWGADDRQDGKRVWARFTAPALEPRAGSATPQPD